MPEIKKLIAGDKTYAVGRWIPTKERLPEDSVYKSYLVTVRPNFNDIATYVTVAGFVFYIYDGVAIRQWEIDSEDGTMIFPCDNNESEYGTITAWMELPEPYREDTHE